MGTATLWRDLRVTDSDGLDESLGHIMDDPAEYVSTITAIDDIGEDESINETHGVFLSIAGEEPDWDTPHGPVKWDGFREAFVNAVRAILDDSEQFERMTIITPTEEELAELNERGSCSVERDGREIVLIGQTMQEEVWAIADPEGDTYCGCTFDVGESIKRSCRVAELDEVPDNYSQSFAVTF